MYQMPFSEISKERGKQYFEEFMQLIMQCHLESTDIIEYFQWQMQTPITNRDPNDRRSKRLSSIVSINNKKRIQWRQLQAQMNTF